MVVDIIAENADTVSVSGLRLDGRADIGLRRSMVACARIEINGVRTVRPAHISFGNASPLISFHAPASDGLSKATPGPTLPKGLTDERSRHIVSPPLRRLPARTELPPNHRSVASTQARRTLGSARSRVDLRRLEH